MYEKESLGYYLTGRLVRITEKDTIARRVADDVFYIQTLIVNVCFIGDPRHTPTDWVLVDTGVAKMAETIEHTAYELYGRGVPPKAIILTHGHFDHIGAVETLAKHWDVKVYAHEAEMPYLTGKESYPPPDPSVSDGLMAKLSPLYPRDPVDLGTRVHSLPAGGEIPVLPGWRWIPTPGHTVGHISLFRAADRVLIAGDAFTTVKQESALAVLTQKQEIHGPPAYFTVNWEEAGESIKRLWELNPSVVITGHGQPMSGEELHQQLGELNRGFKDESIPSQGRYVEEPIPIQMKSGDLGQE